MRQIGPEVPELCSDKQTDSYKQRLQLYIFRVHTTGVHTAGVHTTGVHTA